MRRPDRDFPTNLVRVRFCGLGGRPRCEAALLAADMGLEDLDFYCPCCADFDAADLVKEAEVHFHLYYLYFVLFVLFVLFY